MSEAEASTQGELVSMLARHRLWILTGKGGVGKTSLAAALAFECAAAGRATALLSVGGDGALPALLEVPEERARGSEPVAIREHLWLLSIEPEDALAEYLQLQLHAGGLARRLLRNQGFQRFMDAAPGWRDLVALGKVWQLEQQRAGARPRFDVLFVDAPATGHGLSFLSVPRVVLDTVGMGPLHRQTAEIQALIQDPRRTRCALVALAEELPVRETLELAGAIEQLGVAHGPVLLNRCEVPLEADREVGLRALDSLNGGDARPTLADPELLRAALEFRIQRLDSEAHWRGVLEQGTGERCVRVPYLLEPLTGSDGAARLGRAVSAAFASGHGAPGDLGPPRDRDGAQEQART